MVKICIIGNCQAEKLQQLIPLASPDVNVVTLDGVHKLSGESQRERFVSAYKDVDYIFSHNIASDYPVEFVRTKYIEECFGSKLVRFSNFWFNGYDPSFTLLKNRDGVAIESILGPNHFVHIIRGYLNCESPEAVLKKWRDMHDYEEKAIYLINSSIADFSRRDENCDLKLNDWVLDSYRDSLVCHTVNHPSIGFLINGVNKFLKFLSVRNSILDCELVSDYMKLNFISISPNCFVRRELGLNMPSSRLYKGYAFIDNVVRFEHSKIWQDFDLISAYYAFYNQTISSDIEFYKSSFGN